AKTAKAINLTIHTCLQEEIFLKAWIVVALAQQSLIQIKIDLAGPKQLELLLIPFLVKRGFSALVRNQAPGRPNQG
ncbi:MAG: hypothetical protein WCC81_11800, partial [Pseudolabrys sp.]